MFGQPPPESDICQPKVYTTAKTENVEPRKEERGIGKDDLFIMKECANCSKKIKKTKKAMMCKCKEVLYCSYDCKQGAEHGCQDRMKPAKFTMNEMKDSLNNFIETKEMKRVTEMKRELVKKCKTAKDMMKFAESGDPVAAWLVGCGYSVRIASSAGDSTKSPVPFYMSVKDLEKSVTETDEIAMKWFLIAAEAGLPEGMMSLAHKMFASNGLTTDSRVAFHWLVKALEAETELYGEEIREELEEKLMLSREFDATLGCFEKQLKIYKGRAPVAMISPNLSALLLAARWRELEELNGKTFGGGDFYGFTNFSKILSLLHSNKMVPNIVAGRSGSASYVTRMVVPAERLVTNTRFRQGEKGTRDNGGLLDLEQSTDIKDTWFVTERTQYLMACFHQGDSHVPVGGCYHCHDSALKRVAAVAEGLYSISITETVPEYGYGARYFAVKDGNMRLETFKRYSQPEIRCVLQSLMNNPADLHPLHVAEDPNLYWPVIWFFGSVYSALVECCAHSVVKKIFGKLSKYRSNKISSGSSSLPGPSSAFPSSAVGEMRMACGNESCPNLDHSEKFQKCTGCRVRYYCKPECQRADWSKHKTECSWKK